MIALTRSTYRRRSRMTRAILAAMGVEFDEAVPFWIRNEGRLHWIFTDFERRAREIRIALHPDNGGNVRAAQEFAADEALVRDKFRRHGIGVESPAVREEQDRARRQRNWTKGNAVAKAIRQLAKSKEVA